MQPVVKERSTRETRIRVELLPASGGDGKAIGKQDLSINTGVPFFDHMLTAMLFHGGFQAAISATGDTDVDDHHTVEDVGIVLGQALSEWEDQHGPLARFGHAVVPMDDALAEAVVDAGGRSYLAYSVAFPQERAGSFDLALVREFFQGLAANAGINVHLIGRYALNGHHLAEAVFKACGRALAVAYAPADALRSTKGAL